MRIRNEDKVQLVRQKAMEMLVEQGFEGFSVNKLAKACGISVATLYIYYKDKDDLITKIAREEAGEMIKAVFEGFSPDMPFEEGLRVQWQNRAAYALAYPSQMMFFGQLRNSTYHDEIMAAAFAHFKETLGKFLDNATKRGEIKKMPVEVYWAVAFAPLYSLLRFHHEGKSMGGKPFSLDMKAVWQTFDMVIKAFKS